MRVYARFGEAATFEAMVQYAIDLRVCRWVRRQPQPYACALAVDTSGHAEMKRYLKDLRAQQAAAAAAAAAGAG